MLKNINNWYSEVFRKIHWDYDNPSFLKEIGENFNPEEFAATLKKSNVSAINFFAKDVFGQFYADIKAGKKHPGLKGNLLKEILDICRQNDIKVLFYYVALDNRVPKDWRTIGFKEEVKGISPKISPTWVEPCFNSPFLNEMVIPEVEELSKTYNPDGFFFDIISQRVNMPCYSKYCKDKFKEEFGREIPYEEGDPFWQTYLKWQRNIISNFEKRIADTIHAVNPQIFVGSNYGYTLRMPESPPDYLDYLTLDISEGGRTASNILGISQECHYLCTLNKPFDVMNTRFLYWWPDWMLKPSASLKQECAVMIANGGRCFIGDKIYPDGTLDKRVMEIIGETFAFVKEREEFCRDTKPVPYIAILHSANSYYKQLLPGESTEKKLDNIYGVHKALVESSFHFNILNEDILLQNISSYKVVILPEQISLSKKIAKAIREFVNAGGSLIASCKIGMRDENGDSLNELSELFGVEYKGNYPHKTGYLKISGRIEEGEKGDSYAISLKKYIGDFPIPLQSGFIQVSPTTAVPLVSLLNPLWEDTKLGATPVGPAGEDSNFPAITLNQYGKGKAVLITGEIFSAYWEKNNPYIKYLISNLVNFIAPEKIIEVTAPPCIEVSLFEKDKKKILHLVNSHSEKVLSGVSFAEYLPPIYGIKVRLKMDRKPEYVMEEPGHKKIEYTSDSSYISFEIPKVEIHSIIVVE